MIWTDLLNQPVVGAVEGHIDADDLERLGAHPGDLALRLLLGTGLRRVIVAEHHLLVALRLLVVHPAVERLGFFGVDHALALEVELHLFDRWHQADRHVAHACGVVTEVDPQRAVAVIHYLSHDQQIQFDRLDVGVEVSPDERPGLGHPTYLCCWMELYVQG